jgi:hypothetical protein
MLGLASSSGLMGVQKLVFRGAFGCSTLLKKDAKMRPLKSSGILARATVNSLARTFCADNDTHFTNYSTNDTRNG